MKLFINNKIKLAFAIMLAFGINNANAGPCTKAHKIGREMKPEIVKFLDVRTRRSKKSAGPGRKLLARGAFRVENFDEKKGPLGVRDIGECVFEVSWRVKLERKLGKDRFGRMIILFSSDNTGNYDRSKGLCYHGHGGSYKFKWEKGAPVILPSQGKSFALDVMAVQQQICIKYDPERKLTARL